MNSNLSRIARALRANDTKHQKIEATDEVALIERFLDFKTEHVQTFLRELDLPVSGTKAELRYIVEEAAKENIFSITRLQEYVVGLEPYSHRHLYFFKAPKDYLAELSTREGLREVLKASKHSGLLRTAPPFLIPGLLKPDCVELQDHILRINFVAPALTSIRRPEQDRRDQHSNLVFRVYEEKVSRKLYLFELNLKTGNGFISIPAIQRVQTFQKEFRAITRQVEQVIRVKGLEIIPIGTAIKNLMNEEKSVSRTLGVRYSTGDTVKIKSPKKGIPLFSNQLMKAIEAHTRKGDYFECDFYYAIGDKPQFRFMVYEDERLGLMTDLDEEVFRDVVKLVLENL